MNNFKEKEATQLDRILTHHQVLTREETEALVFGLMEIAESVDEIYSRIIPGILSAGTHANLKDKLWDLRDEFRHIQYHIDDGKLKDL